MQSFHFYLVAILFVRSLSKQLCGWGGHRTESKVYGFSQTFRPIHICAQRDLSISFSSRPQFHLSFSFLHPYFLPVSPCSWINKDTYHWLSLLPYEVDNQLHCSNFCLWENFLTTVVQSKPSDVAMQQLSASGYSQPIVTLIYKQDT